MESASRSTSTPTTTRLSGDAALVLGLAATAMPFSHSAEDQSESWLRTLRLHGGVGKALAGLGMSEEQLIARAVPARQCTGTPVPDGDVVERVARSAVEFTVARGGQTTGTADLFFALLRHLRAHDGPRAVHARHHPFPGLRGPCGRQPAELAGLARGRALA